MKRAVVFTKEERWIVATDFSSGVASQGRTMDEALSNLQEALALYYEDAGAGVEADIFATSLIEVAV